MKVLFFGTPQVAVPFLERLVAKTTVVGAVCRPDEPAGRGQEIKAPPVKLAAQKHGIPVFQPAGPWASETVSALQDLGADLGVIVAYGRILPRNVFDAPLHGSVNVHFSLLPDLRGASPIQSALIYGHRETGVSLFWLDEGLDSGPLFDQRKVAVDPMDDVASLREKLVAVGLTMLDNLVAKAEARDLVRTPQRPLGPGDRPAPILPKKKPGTDEPFGRLHWADASAVEIFNRVRGLSEGPVAETSYAVDGEVRRLKVYKAGIADENSTARPDAGRITNASPDGIVVETKAGSVLLTEVQPDGKKRMPAWAFWQGSRLRVGDHLG